ncbi:MAG TPA: TadE/TadG family type IV pilus assembly protein [Candidatus Acidoferrum sp.]|nr:TadE/TadG family type IV pilus assembly protein [Candidatus Acidoferrum sp.]
MRTAKHSERGASMAETAIVMTCVLLLIFGIIDFARMTYTYSFVANAARMGARWMIVRGTSSCTSGNGIQIDNCNAKNSALTSYVQNLDVGLLKASNITVTGPTYTLCPGTATGGGPGCTVTVVVSYPFAFIAPYFTKAAWQVSSTSQMIVSQ